MEKMLIPLVILLLILAGVISFLSFNIIKKNFTSAAIIETYSYTKAICDSDNYCQDYHISCNGAKMLDINPLTGAAVQFPSDWQDPRSEEVRNGFCG